MTRSFAVVFLIALRGALLQAHIFFFGLLADANCQSSLDALDHTILAVGYGVDATSGQQYWIVRNNWSIYWGVGGYMTVATANNICGVATAPTYALLK